MTQPFLRMNFIGYLVVFSIIGIGNLPVRCIGHFVKSSTLTLLIYATIINEDCFATDNIIYAQNKLSLSLQAYTKIH
jgi:hypothetical protein